MMKLQITEEFCEKEIYDIKEKNLNYKKALLSFLEALNSGDAHKTEDAVTYLETIVCDLVYVKGYNDGVRSILKTLAGEDIAEISYTE